MKTSLDYLKGDSPERGGGVGMLVGPDLYWLVMPLPGRLAAINVWALRERGAWTVVDTGFCTDDVRAGWAAVRARLFGGEPIARVICTHMHADHCGMAGELVRQDNASFWMAPLEYLAARMFAAGDTEFDSAALTLQLRQAGLDEDMITAAMGWRHGVNELMSPVPAAFHAMADGDVIAIGDGSWQVVQGSGHSMQHCSLYNARDRLLIAGDQVLPHISSNVSVTHLEPDANPLARWLSSLRRLREIVPDDVLVLPAHGCPFYGLHRRIDALLGHHEKALAILHAALGAWRRPADLLSVLFRRPIQPQTATLAVGEALAHLAYLRGVGDAEMRRDQDGAMFWRAT